MVPKEKEIVTDKDVKRTAITSVRIGTSVGTTTSVENAEGIDSVGDG